MWAPHSGSESTGRLGSHHQACVAFLVMARETTFHLVESRYSRWKVTGRKGRCREPAGSSGAARSAASSVGSGRGLPALGPPPTSLASLQVREALWAPGALQPVCDQRHAGRPGRELAHQVWMPIRPKEAWGPVLVGKGAVRLSATPRGWEVHAGLGTPAAWWGRDSSPAGWEAPGSFALSTSLCFRSDPKALYCLGLGSQDPGAWPAPPWSAP